MTKCAELLNRTIEVDFVDINVGCPIDLVYKKVVTILPWIPRVGRLWIGQRLGTQLCSCLSHWEPMGVPMPQFPHLHSKVSEGCWAQLGSCPPMLQLPVSPRVGAARS